MTVTEVGSGEHVRTARNLVRVAGLIFYLLAAQALLTAGVGLSVYLSGGAGPDLVLPASSLLMAACYTAVGYYLRRYRVWARNFAFAFAAVSLFAFPVGTVLGVVVVVCIDRANRARVFATWWPAVPAPAPKARTVAPLLDEARILRFEPELAAERLG
jgi:hypothetical protein